MMKEHKLAQVSSSSQQVKHRTVLVWLSEASESALWKEAGFDKNVEQVAWWWWLWCKKDNELMTIGTASELCRYGFSPEIGDHQWWFSTLWSHLRFKLGSNLWRDGL